MNRHFLFLLKVLVGMVYCVLVGVIFTLFGIAGYIGILLAAMIHFILGVSSFTNNVVVPIMGNNDTGGNSMDDSVIRESIHVNTELNRQERGAGTNAGRGRTVPLGSLAKEIFWYRGGWDLILTAVLTATWIILPMFE